MNCRLHQHDQPFFRFFLLVVLVCASNGCVLRVGNASLYDTPPPHEHTQKLSSIYHRHIKYKKRWRWLLFQTGRHERTNGVPARFSFSPTFCPSPSGNRDIWSLGDVPWYILSLCSPGKKKIWKQLLVGYKRVSVCTWASSVNWTSPEFSLMSCVNELTRCKWKWITPAKKF